MYDVIIAGGGPAGSIAAKRAAKNGLSVLVLEKEAYPRDKTCGGGVSQKALDVIGGIDKGLIEREIFGARIFLPDYQNFTGRIGSRVAVTTMRRNLDHWLINRAEDSGAMVHDNEPVKDIKFSKDCVEVATPKDRYQSRMIVGSDGVNSTVARKSGIRTRWGSNIGLCLETEVELGETLVEECVETDIGEFYFRGPWSYGWVFPKRDRLSIGIGGHIPQMHKPMDIFMSFVRDVSLQKKIDLEERITRINSHLIPLGGVDRRIHGERVILAGDAAGFVDPFLGEGLYYAVKSGEIAADAAALAVENDDFSQTFLAGYAARCENAFGSDLKSARRFAKFAYGKPDRFLKILRSDRRLFLEYLKTVRGDRTYAGFNRWCAMRSPVTFMKLVSG
jgi:geranylgeranyl reductase family protein